MHLPKLSFIFQLLINCLIISGIIVLAIFARFPIKLFIYNFVFLSAVILILYIISRRIKFSCYVSIVLLSTIILISVKKSSITGTYLILSDIKIFLSDPEFIIEYVSWLIYPLIALLFLLAAAQLKIEKKAKIKSKIFILSILSVVYLCYLTTSLTNSELWRVSPVKHTLYIFLYSIVNQSDAKLDLPNQKIIDGECCMTSSDNDLDYITNIDDATKPNIIVILLESTTDISKIKGINIQSNWGEFNSSQIKTYVKGGNTWVPEYALLNGVPPHLYGKHFHNINFLGINKVKGRLPNILRNAGYETTSMLTYKKNWYNSNNYHQSLGIQNIIDCKIMNSCSSDYPTRDRVMLENAALKIQNSDKPQFIFGLTMDQHSPHNFSGGDKKIACESTLSKVACDNINEYYNREIVLQTSLLNFFEQLNQINKPTYVFLFGDHIPGAFSENIPANHFENSDQFATIAFGYSNLTRSTFPIHSILLACRADYTFQISDLDALILKYAKLNSKYLEDKIDSIKQKCTTLR